MVGFFKSKLKMPQPIVGKYLFVEVDKGL